MSKLVDRDKVFDDKFKLLRRDLDAKELTYIKSWCRFKMLVAGSPVDGEESQEGQRIYDERHHKKKD